MKRLTNLFLVITAAILLFSACNDDENYYYDYEPPAKPTNVLAINGDERIDLTWKNNREADLSGYNVYFSYDNYEFDLIGSTEENYYIDYDARNGEIYYYAVTAYDFDGNESDLSESYVVGIARPEGFNQAVFDYINFPESAGFTFEDYSVVPFDLNITDFFFENYEGSYYINVWDDGDIQDMGPTDNIYNISEAPSGGWVQLVPGENVKYLVPEVGHTYVIRTNHNHYAKIRVRELTGQRMSFDWAFQLIEGETLLKSSSSDAYQKRNMKVVKKIYE